VQPRLEAHVARGDTHVLGARDRTSAAGSPRDSAASSRPLASRRTALDQVGAADDLEAARDEHARGAVELHLRRIRLHRVHARANRVRRQGLRRACRRRHRHAQGAQAVGERALPLDVGDVGERDVVSVHDDFRREPHDDRGRRRDGGDEREQDREGEGSPHLPSPQLVRDAQHSSAVWIAFEFAS